ncbi:MAG: hypothetical protein ABL893_19350 [Hyphomicrobium sp.]
MPPHPIPKLPVWKTIADVYIVTARHLGDLLRFSWPWLVVLIAVSMALYSAYYQSERALLAAGGTRSNLLWALMLATSTLIGALIAVPWHRRILLNEPQTLSQGLSLDARKVVYVVKAMAISASLVLPLIALMWAIPSETAGEAATKVEPEFSVFDLWPLIFFITFFAVIFALNRVSLILPATAVENRSVTLARAWRGSRGNTLRLGFVSIIATFLPIIVPVQLIQLVAPALVSTLDANTAPNALSFATANTISELFTILFGMLFVTFLSLSYRHFFGQPEAAHD